MRSIICGLVCLLSFTSNTLAIDSYMIENAIDDEWFIINGEKFQAHTYCLGWEESDEVIFLDGDANGACASAKIFNKTPVENNAICGVSSHS